MYATYLQYVTTCFTLFVVCCFRPFGQAEDKGSRSAAPEGAWEGCHASAVGIKDVPSADPLRQVPVRGCPPRSIVVGRRPRGKMVLLTCAETKVTRVVGP